MKLFRLLTIVAVAATLTLVVSGCSKKKVAIDDVSAPIETAAEADESAKGSLDEAVFEEGMASEAETLETTAEPSVEVVSQQHPILEGRTNAPLLPIYFDFDRSDIREDQRGRLEKNGSYLKANKAVKVRIEGNCDERGTNEYNLALGERRALSAQRYLVNLGVDKKRITTISYGEEKPLLYGHDELSWAQNRRDDFSIID